MKRAMPPFKQPMHFLDMYVGLYLKRGSSTMMRSMHSKKELMLLFEGVCIFGYREFYKKILCILIEVNKTIYGNIEDVPDNFWSFYF
jgi:hypothetical protein